mmetsp:Transcript_11393/g.27873  ORF Transcript_11393/g.27873 Transcript_11393/m.27873 type:complete len:105 (-) Transcript_11393:230-544(-)
MERGLGLTQRRVFTRARHELVQSLLADYAWPGVASLQQGLDALDAAGVTWAWPEGGNRLRVKVTSLNAASLVVMFYVKNVYCRGAPAIAKRMGLKRKIRHVGQG